jgi:hypothetical protein
MDNTAEGHCQGFPSKEFMTAKATDPSARPNAISITNLAPFGMRFMVNPRAWKSRPKGSLTQARVWLHKRSTLWAARLTLFADQRRSGDGFFAMIAIDGGFALGRSEHLLNRLFATPALSLIVIIYMLCHSRILAVFGGVVLLQ